MEFLYFLESMRNPVLDFLFSMVTHLGEETFFLVFAILIFWCVNKRGGYYILITGLIGTVINQGLKLIFRIDRPWILDPEFKPIDSAIEEATGYSFPSGHTQNATGTFGSVAMFFRRNWVRITSVVTIILVALSRMYLGVHTPLDVSVSLLLACALILIFYPIFTDEDRFRKAMPYVIGVCFLLSLALLVFVSVLPDSSFATASELENLASGRKNASTLFGCMLGLVLVYPLDTLVTKFETNAVWYSQVIKLVLGIGGVLIIKEGLRKPLELLVGLFTGNPEYIARGIRYFVIVAFAGAVWPLTFKFFSRFRIFFMDRFTDWFLSIFKKNQHASTHGDEESGNK